MPDSPKTVSLSAVRDANEPPRTDGQSILFDMENDLRATDRVLTAAELLIQGHFRRENGLDPEICTIIHQLVIDARDKHERSIARWEEVMETGE